MKQPRPTVVQFGHVPKGCVADHWTNRAQIGAPFRFTVTGVSPKLKRGQQQVDPVPAPVSRGVVSTATAKRSSPVQPTLL